MGLEKEHHSLTGRPKSSSKCPEKKGHMLGNGFTLVAFDSGGREGWTKDVVIPADVVCRI